MACVIRYTGHVQIEHGNLRKCRRNQQKRDQYHHQIKKGSDVKFGIDWFVFTMEASHVFGTGLLFSGVLRCVFKGVQKFHRRHFHTVNNLCGHRLQHAENQQQGDGRHQTQGRGVHGNGNASR